MVGYTYSGSLRPAVEVYAGVLLRGDVDVRHPKRGEVEPQVVEFG